MIKKIGIVIVILLIFSLAINFGYAQATLISINNAGFERPGLYDGAYIDYIEHPELELVGWDIYYGTPGAEDTACYKAGVGIWNPRYLDYPNGIPQGRQVGYVDVWDDTIGIVGLEQTLEAKLEKDMSYSLQVDVGNTLWIGHEGYLGFPGYRIELAAGDVVLASDDNTLSPAEREFCTSTVSFTQTAATDYLLEENLTIRLLNLSTGQGQEVDFDNVRLDATPVSVPEPSTLLLLGIGLVGLAGINRKKK